MKQKFGTHISIADGLATAIDVAEDLGCDTFQIFTKSNRQWHAKPLKAADVSAFIDRKAASTIDPIFVHTSYLINLAANDAAIRRRSLAGLVDELKRAEKLQLPFVVLHPGSHVGDGEETGLKRIAENLKRAITRTDGFTVRIALETMAGQGSTLGHEFEHIAALYDAVDCDERLGVCLDSCHMFAAGHDIAKKKGYEITVKALDATIGISRVLAIHMNDSKHGCGECKDRHEHIGKGKIGKAGFRLLVNDKRLRHLPMVLETPKGKDLADDRANLKTLRSLVK